MSNIDFIIDNTQKGKAVIVYCTKHGKVWKEGAGSNDSIPACKECCDLLSAGKIRRARTYES